MGKARILSEVGAGQYLIERLPDREFADREKERMEAHRGTLQGQLVIAEEEEDRARTEAETAQAAVHALLDAFPEDPDARADHLSAITDAQRTFMRARLNYEKAQSASNRMRMHLESLRVRISTIEKGEPPASEVAWCADYTEGMAGEVGTIERNDEGSALPLNIAPGTSPMRPVVHLAGDGDLRPRYWQSPEQVFFNAAILPGVQRHRPQYRSGIITSIDATENECSVTLDVAASSAAGLGINPDDRNLSGVPIVYMGCDSEAFEEGDHVLVQFQGRDWSQPVVIGFVREPEPCISEQGYTFRPVDDITPDGWPGAVNSSEYWHAYTSGGPVELDEDVLLRAQPHFWRGNKNRIVSFNHGGQGRYGWRLFNPSPEPALARVPGTPTIYILGSRITTGDLKVVGAAMFRDALVIITRNDGEADQLYYTENPYPQLRADSIAGFDPVEITPTWSLAGPIATHRMPWFFSPTGEEATTVEHDPATRNEKIRTITLSGGIKDPDTDELVVSIASTSLEDWGDPFSSLAEIDTSSAEVVNVHATKGAIAGWGAKAGGPLAGADASGYVQGTWGFPWAWKLNPDWDGSTIREDLQGATPPYELITGTITEDAPDAFYAERDSPAGFADLGFAWPSKFTDYRLVAREIDGNAQIAEVQVTIERRPVYTATYNELRDLKVVWEISGSVLLAMDYLPSGRRIPVTLQPDPAAKNSPEVSWLRKRIVPYMAGRDAAQVFNIVMVGDALYKYHKDGTLPQGTDGVRWPAAALNKLSGANPGYSGWASAAPYEERAIAQSGSLRFHIAVDGVPVPGTAIGGDSADGTGVDMDEIWTRSDWDWQVTGWADGGLPTTSRTGSAQEPVQTNPWVIASYFLMDFDAVNQAVAKVGLLHEMTVRTTIGDANSLDLNVEREQTGGELYLRGEKVTLPDAAAGDNPTETILDWQTYTGFNLSFLMTIEMMRNVFDPFAIGLSSRTTTNGPNLLGINFQETRNALVVRDGQSAMFSYVDDTNSDRRAVFAQFNGNPYTLEATITLPTKDNLRLLDIGAV